MSNFVLGVVYNQVIPYLLTPGIATFSLAFPGVHCCNTLVESQLFARTAFQLTFPTCVRLVVGAQFVMRQRRHQSLSARGIELPMPSTLMGDPHRDRLVHLIKCSEPRRRIILDEVLLLKKKKNSHSNQYQDYLY